MQRFVHWFPLWVTAGSVLALLYPPAFTWFLDLDLVTPGLQVIMLGMGLTLTLGDFARVVRAPKAVMLGVLLQYSVMPGLGLTIAHVFGLPGPFAAGLILVCCCPGGTASNVVTYLARADVALSVAMTSVSTLLAAACTPTLTTLLVGNRIEVDPLGLFTSTAKVVLGPVLVGLLLRRYAPRLTERLLPFSPAAAVLAIVLIVGAILGAQRGQVVEAGLRLAAAIFTAHAAGFTLGYVLGGLVVGFGNAARTLSIEVGMQNSGLGVVLARSNFADPLVAIPSAISSIFHCVIGSALAAVWSRMSPRRLASQSDSRTGELGNSAEPL